jgi:hypothetical protein
MKRPMPVGVRGGAGTLIALLLMLTGIVGSAAPAQAAAPGWHLLAANGPTNLAPFSSERQTVTAPIFGTFTLTFGGDTTTALASDAPASGAGSVEEALNALPSVSAGGGSVSVAPGRDGFGYLVTFDGGPLAGTDVPLMTASGFGAAVAPTPSGEIVIYATNVGGAATSGSYTVEVDLPDGITTSSTASGSGWSCGPAGAGQSSFSCTASAVVGAGNRALPILAPVVVSSAAPGVSGADLSIAGGAASPVSADMPITVSNSPAEAGVQAYWAAAYDENGNPDTQAGGHPHSAFTGFLLNTITGPTGRTIPAGSLKDVVVDPPVGFVANPLATPRCPRIDPLCDNDDSIVGRVAPITLEFGAANAVGGALKNGVPTPGSAAQFAFPYSLAKITTVGRLRPQDYGVTAVSPNLPTDYKPFGAIVNLWGAPGASLNDEARCFTGGCALPNPGGVDDAFLTNPTECSGTPLPTLLSASSWQAPAAFSTRSFDSPPTTDCASVPFEPAVEITPTSSAPDSASGLSFDLTLPQDGLLDPDGIATSHLKDVVVDLPEGMAVNPSAATGLAACSDAQMAVGSDSAPQCPDGSKLGTVEITSPLADHPLGGTLYLATPKSTDPMSGQMLRLFVVARDDELGVMIKLPGSATADTATGKLTATFENNPRLPFDHLSVKLKGGGRGVLAMPQDCGSKANSATLSPWSGTAPVTDDSPFVVAGDCSLGFAPALAAGMDSRKARGSGSFSFRFSRRDGEQWIDGLTTSLPKGLLASVKDVPLCAGAQAAAGSCPAGSRIGTVDASAGSGDPFVLERKGDAYLTEGYKGCAYGLVVKVPVVAGPFDASSPETDLGDIVVRQAVCVDRSTAEVSVVSDPFPTIWHGIPLRVRSVTVRIDRPGFMLNPSDCSAKEVGVSFHSARGGSAGATNPFRADGCAALPFKPDLKLSLTGRKQVTTGKHPGIKATVAQAGTAEAGIGRVEVRLPKSLALDPENAQALCEFEDGTKPDLENRCPKGSIVGRARAKTPLLRNELSGNVYFVKNVRKDPTTGNLIRTLPMIVVALRGEIAINLKGESSTTKSGRLVNTFANIPDAPISQFNLNIAGGKTGIIAVTRTRKAKINLCTGRHTAESDIDGHNGRRYDTDVRMKTPCTKKQTKAAKLRAKRAAAKAGN